MGWSYRKSISAGPFRLNISRSGVGYSVGGKGFRTGIRSSGRKYTSVSVPGTGLRYIKTGASGCLVLIATGIGLLTWAVFN